MLELEPENLERITIEYANFKVSSASYINHICQVTAQSLLFLQQEYILGKNPQQMSYMVGDLGFGKSFPSQPYHKGSSIPSKLVNEVDYGCATGTSWKE